MNNNKWETICGVLWESEESRCFLMRAIVSWLYLHLPTMLLREVKTDVYIRMRIYTYIHRYVHMSSTTADSSQHASPQQVRHIWVSHPRRKTTRVRARDSDIYCHARQSIAPFIASTGIQDCSLRNWRKRFLRIFLRCISDDSNAKKIVSIKNIVSTLLYVCNMYVRIKRMKKHNIDIYSR